MASAACKQKASLMLLLFTLSQWLPIAVKVQIPLSALQSCTTCQFFSQAFSLIIHPATHLLWPHWPFFCPLNMPSFLFAFTHPSGKNLLACHLHNKLIPVILNSLCCLVRKGFPMIQPE
jgi:hypothetical protein